MSTKQKTGLWFLAIVVFLILFVTFALPQIGKYYAKNWLLEQGAEQAEIHKVRLNPFMGRLGIEGFSFQFPEAEPVSIQQLSLEWHWRSLWSRRVHINSLQVAQASTPLLVNDQQIQLGELMIWQATEASAPEQEETVSAPWFVQVDSVQFTDWRVPVRLFETDTGLHIRQLALSALDSSASEQPMHLDFTGDINDDPVKWQTDITAFAEQPVIAGHWQFDGLDLSRFAPLMGEGMAQLRGVLAGDTQLRLLVKEQGVELDQDGNLSLTDFTLPDILTSQSLAWSGKTHLSLTFDDAVGSLELNGSLNSQQLQPVLEGLDVTAGEANWNGELRMPVLNDPDTLSTAAALAFKQLRVADTLNEQSIASAKLVGMKIEPGLQVSMEKVALANIALVTQQYPDADLALQQLQLSGLQYSSAGLSIQDSSMTDLALAIVRDKQGDWQLPYVAVENDEPETGETESKPLPVEIGLFQLTGNNRIVFDDRSVAPSAKNTLLVEQLQVKDIATENKGNWSPFALTLKQGDYGKLDFKGKLRNPGSKMDLEMQSEIKQIDLHAWSSYLASATGYQVAHGMLDSTLDVKVTQGQLDANTEWLLNQLAVERADDTRAQQMEASMSMPLDSALSMLRDGDDNIRLKIPVTGDLQSPDFDISDVMNKAIATALKKTTMTYLKYALQPYGALLMLGEAVGSRAGEVKFAPIEFMPADVTLSSESLDYLTKLGGLLQERPGMQVKVCGIGVLADLTDEQRQLLAQQATDKPVLDEALKAALLELAGQRAAEVKRQLVEQYGIKPEQIFTCLPNIEFGADALPRVELSL